MLAISAKLAYTSVWPVAQMMKPQNKSGVPPLMSANPRYVRMPSQLAMQVEAKPSIVMKLKLRRSTCFLPSMFMSWTSEVVP